METAMCEGCEGPDDPAERSAPAPALVALARDIERRRDGEPAPDWAWAIFLGEQGGSLPWRDFIRLSGSMEEAARRWRFVFRKPQIFSRSAIRADAPGS
jgi:hypothetical protein